jgi:hypothetical protein
VFDDDDLVVERRAVSLEPDELRLTVAVPEDFVLGGGELCVRLVAGASRYTGEFVDEADGRRVEDEEGACL